MKKVMVFGTFDPVRDHARALRGRRTSGRAVSNGVDGLHLGHLNFFKQAQKYGHYLIAVIARDRNVKKIKKHFPARGEKERLKIVQNSKLVDKAILGNKDNPYLIIKKIKPDVICLGYDQKTFVENLPKELKKMNLKTKIYRLKPYQPKKYHSSRI